MNKDKEIVELLREEKKKPYKKPELKELGNLIEFTLGSAPGALESGGGCGGSLCFLEGVE